MAPLGQDRCGRRGGDRGGGPGVVEVARGGSSVHGTITRIWWALARRLDGEFRRQGVPVLQKPQRKENAMGAPPSGCTRFRILPDGDEGK